MTRPLPTLCPRCAKPMNPRVAMNSVSRVDNTTYICSQCGQNEALADHLGFPLTPVTEPVRYDLELPASPRNIRCPACGAPSGSPCTVPTDTGRTPMAGYHHVRSDLAAGWT